MSPESASVARLHAVEVSGDESVVEGPLRGYHHETYVFPLLGEGEGGLGRSGRWKCREPRDGLLWFDRRCFDSDEQVLQAIAGRIGGIPELIELGGVKLQRFVEGRTLGSICKSGTSVPDVFLQQIMNLFRELIPLTAENMTAERRCDPVDRPKEGDTDGFLERLIHFTEHSVYLRNADRFERLFANLGVGPGSFERLRGHVLGLHRRPFCLLHADLHRENFIVDAELRLWTIDWELSMVGDPVYDLATHLHLMRYPERQAREVVKQWCAIAESVRRGSSNGVGGDLASLLDYKRAQSVFTDVMRTALSLESDAGSERRLGNLFFAALRLRGILADAAVPLGLESVPGPHRIATELRRWCREGEPLVLEAR